MSTEEPCALPRPSWMTSNSEENNNPADARVQSIRDIIRVRKCLCIILADVLLFLLHDIAVHLRLSCGFCIEIDSFLKIFC